MRIVEEVRAQIARFDEAGVPASIRGRLALAAHRWPRATMGLAIMVSAEHGENVCEIARDLGLTHEAGELVLGQGMVRIRRLVKFQEKSSFRSMMLVTPGM